MMEHTNKQFDAEMESIRSGVLTMGGLVETQMSRAIESLMQDKESAVLDVIGANEQQINQMQVDMDQLCSQIIARRQPTAIDLRMILTVTKIVNDLERIGDETKKVAYKASESTGHQRLARVRYYDVARSAERAKEMLQGKTEGIDLAAAQAALVEAEARYRAAQELKGKRS